MFLAAGDVPGSSILTLGKPKGCGDKSITFTTLNALASELGFSGVSPGEDLTFIVEGEGVVGAACDLGNFLQARDKDRLGLNLFVRTAEETGDTTTALDVQLAHGLETRKLCLL